MPSRPIAKGTSTSEKTSTAGVSSGSSTKEWARLRARLFPLRNRSGSSAFGGREEQTRQGAASREAAPSEAKAQTEWSDRQKKGAVVLYDYAEPSIRQGYD